MQQFLAHSELRCAEIPKLCLTDTCGVGSLAQDARQNSATNSVVLGIKQTAVPYNSGTPLELGAATGAFKGAMESTCGNGDEYNEHGLDRLQRQCTSS